MWGVEITQSLKQRNSVHIARSGELHTYRVTLHTSNALRIFHFWGKNYQHLNLMKRPWKNSNTVL